MRVRHGATVGYGMWRCAAALWGALGCAQGSATQSPSDVDPSVTLMAPQGKVRVIDFTTDEGTGVSLDVSPDGQWIVFDLLGQLYRLSAAGGEATPLTGNSGQALNFHPVYSADGRSIAFISDRQGQNNVWVMNADGTQPRPVFLERETRFMHPAWAPDGKSIVAVRVYPTPGRGWHRQTSELWRLPLDGSAPARVLGEKLMHYDAPAFSPDGRHLYFHVSYSTGEGLGLLTAGHRIQRLEIATGKVENVRTKDAAQLSPEFIDALKKTAYSADNEIDPPAALDPVVSPDGQAVAFGLERKGELMVYRGHSYQPRTSVAVRNLATGAEKIVLDTAEKDVTMVNAQYGYGSFPRLAWWPDSKSVVAMAGGKLRRVDVATGQQTIIPFTARVHRVLSEMTRNSVTINDSAFTVKLIQWPVGSPDGKRVAFVAVGKIWLMDVKDSVPKPLTAEVRPTLQLTPAWSPNGKEIAFTSWNDAERGAVWVVSAAGGAPRQVSHEASEYLYPAWTSDGSAIVVSRGPGPQPNGRWNGWNTAVGWTAVRIPTAGGPAVAIAPLNGPHRAVFGNDGRLYFEYRDRADEAPRLLYYPFPSPAAESLVSRVRSVAPNGGDTRDHLAFPPLREEKHAPTLSPTNRWVAFINDEFVYVAPVPRSNAGALPMMNPNPNDSVPGRVRVGDFGGTYQSWRDSTVLQFASGNRYVTYDAATGRTQVVPVRLKVPRPTPAGAIALTNARIITVDSGGVIERGTVVVRGSRITCVGECDTTGVPRVLDLTGKTIIPGLFDLHAHHTDESSGIITPHRSSSALDMAYGVTTILDPNTSSESLFPLADLISAGVMVGPRSYGTAEMVISPGVAWGHTKILRSQADADLEVNRRADWGAMSIKNFRQSGRYQQQFLINAARKRQMSITSEGGPLYFDVGVVLDGQTGWEHLLANLPIYKDASTFFGKAGIVYSPTSIVAGHVFGSMAYYRPQQHLDTDAKYQRFMPAPELRRRLAGSREYPKSMFSFPIIAEGLADIVRAGGRGVLGEHGEQYGIGTHWELWGYAEALRPVEVLKVATLDGAFSLGLDRELGSITRGKIADLVILNANPLDDIKNTANISHVMKEGHLYDASTLDEQWPARRAYGPIPWQ